MASRSHRYRRADFLSHVPRARGSDAGPEEVREALSEHDRVKSVLTEIEQTSPTDYTFKTKISELRRPVEQHVQEEEHGMLPQARKLFSQDELDELAYRMIKLMSIHSPVYQVGGNKVRTMTRDTIHRIARALPRAGGHRRFVILSLSKDQSSGTFRAAVRG